MKLEDFNYNLPKELIAQTPYLKRDEARLLVVSKEKEEFEDKKFSNILEYSELFRYSIVASEIALG